MSKIRIDRYLHEHGFFPSRERAKAAVLAGLVKIDQIPVTKAGEQVPEELDPETVSVKGDSIPYVSRGGLKLEKGIKVFPFPVEGRIFCDVGASTGGFTDVLLKNGAKKVYAIDVGYGQLDWTLRNDERVVNLERTNFRHLDAEKIPKVDGTVMDVSFISIQKLLPKLYEIMKENAFGIWLVKPQFEAGREKVGKKGVVRDPKVHQEVLENTVRAVIEQGFTVRGIDRSPIKGPSGNVEFLLFVEKCPSQDAPESLNTQIRKLTAGDEE